MRAKHGIVRDRSKTANVLGITPDEIDAAWDYWGNVGVIRRDYMLTTHIEWFLSRFQDFTETKKVEALEVSQRTGFAL